VHLLFFVFDSESRYLLILTENYAALGILQQELLKIKNAIIIFGSSFPKDQEYTQVGHACNNSLSCIQTHTHPFYGPLSGTTQVSQYRKGKTNLDFTEARDNEWQWHQLGHMQVCISLQADNHASTPLLSFLQAECPSCRPTNCVKALKAKVMHTKLFFRIS